MFDVSKRLYLNKVERWAVVFNISALSHVALLKVLTPYSNVSCSQTKQTIVSRSAGIPLDITQGVLLLDVIVSFSAPRSMALD